LTQNAEIVEMIVKFHFNQKKTDLFIAENASKITNQNQDKVAVDLVETEMVETEVAEVDLVEIEEEMIDHEKCLTQNAEIVEMIVKYHFNQKKTDLFIAENASKIIDNTSELFL
jgi:hypothetical protein